MQLPKVPKRFSDLLPKVGDLAGKVKVLGAGVLMAAIGTVSPGQPTTPALDAPSLSAEKDTPTAKLIMQQSGAPASMHAQHYSHSSHSSHYSHSSHFSHYSSR